MTNPPLDAFGPLYTSAQIAARVRELGAQISRDFAGEQLIVVGVLKGAALFMSDLIRAIDVPLRCDFLRVSSYEGGLKSTGVVRFEFDITQTIEDQNVILVEDIVDTGLTANFLYENLKLRRPKSLRFCTLLHKSANTKINFDLDYIGFTIPNRFVIGYGLDLDGLYRNLPDIRALPED